MPRLAVFSFHAVRRIRFSIHASGISQSLALSETLEALQLEGDGALRELEAESFIVLGVELLHHAEGGRGRRQRTLRRLWLRGSRLQLRENPCVCLGAWQY